MIQESIEQIQKRLETKFRSIPPFNGYNLSPSATAVWDNFLFTIATEIFTLQQQNNIYESEIEGIISRVTTPTELWWQVQILKFQYSDTDPQVIQLDTTGFFPYYFTVNESLRIITNCSVTTQSNNIIQIKVTNNGNTLTADQIKALNAYVATIAPAGIDWIVINKEADRLYLNAEIFYNGQYSAVIQSNVIAAIDAYLAALPFDGIVKISAIEDAIQSVAGVTDVVINTAAARAADTAFISKTVFSRYWQTVSGQIIQEDESGQTFADTLTFTIANN